MHVPLQLMKDLQKGLTKDEFWRLVEQVTRQKPNFRQEEKNDSITT